MSNTRQPSKEILDDMRRAAEELRGGTTFRNERGMTEAVKSTEAAAALRESEEERQQLLDELRRYAHGYKGACYACEPVGELSMKLRAENERLKRDLRAANKGAERNMKLAEAVTTTNMNLKTENERLKQERDLWERRCEKAWRQMDEAFGAKLASEYRAAPAPEWVKVEDRMPTPDDSDEDLYVWWTNGKEVYQGPWYLPEKGATHWMPKPRAVPPEPPEEE